MSTDRAALVEWMPAAVEGRRGQRLMVVLRAPGCAWARRCGCTNCAFPTALTSGGPVSAEEFEQQLCHAAGSIPPDASGPLQIDLFVSGSFFNPEEVPPDGQARLLSAAARLPGAARLFVESRPEYVSAEALSRARSAAGGLPLEVGIGLESADDDIRRRRIRKGFSWAQFERAARTLATAGAALAIYVLLKPMDTGEAEALADSVRTAERVFGLGKTLGLQVRCLLQPTFVPPGTPLTEAYRAGRYRPPSLWTVVEAARRIAPLGPLQVGLSDEGLQPLAVPDSCPRCRERLLMALSAFNADGAPAALEGLDCACRAEWTRTLA